LSKGTAAEGAEIVIESVPFMVRCKECNTIYHINVFDDSTWPCPHCAQKDYVLYSGMEFTVDKVIVDHVVDQVAAERT
jgi:hydrogenase nickel incorporation protein HypA/HybF